MTRPDPNASSRLKSTFQVDSQVWPVQMYKCRWCHAIYMSVAVCSGITVGGGSCPQVQQVTSTKYPRQKYFDYDHKSEFDDFYRAMHFSAYARSWDRMSSVHPSVRPSVTLVDYDHISWKSWKLIARTISPTPSQFVAKRRSTYSQGNMGKFWGD